MIMGITHCYYNTGCHKLDKISLDTVHKLATTSYNFRTKCIINLTGQKKHQQQNRSNFMA
jgi:hypothetical protein